MLSDKTSHDTIYICDDEEGMLLYLKKMVSEWGFDVVAHSSPLSLLDFLERTEDEGKCLLLDIKMPDMDG